MLGTHPRSRRTSTLEIGQIGTAWPLASACCLATMKAPPPMRTYKSEVTTLLQKLHAPMSTQERVSSQRRGQGIKSTSSSVSSPHQNRLVSLLPDLPTTASQQTTRIESEDNLFHATTTIIIKTTTMEGRQAHIAINSEEPPWRLPPVWE